MRIIFARHGQTIENKNDISQSAAGGHLNTQGKSQANKLAKRLSKEKIDIIYCSDSKRCKDTLAPYIKTNKNIQVIYTKELRERNSGIFQDKHHDIMRAWIQKEKEKNPGKNDFRFPKGESYNDMRKRSIKFIDRLIKKEKSKHVLVVSHGGPISMMLIYLFNKHPRTHFKKYLPKNTAVSIVHIKDDGKHHARLINCYKHLKN